MVTFRRTSMPQQTATARVLPMPERKPETLREAITLVVRTALSETGVPVALHSMLTLKITDRTDAELREMAGTVIHIADFLKQYMDQP